MLGFDVSGPLDLGAADLLGREAYVEFLIEEWTDRSTGKRTERLAVPFLGYEPASNDSPF